MANSYCQATMDPDCVHLTDDQQLWLEASFAEMDPGTDSEGRKGFYVLWRECFTSEPEQERFQQVLEGNYDHLDAEEAEAAIQKHLPRLEKPSFERLLQSILRNPENSHIEKIRVEGAYTCSRMLPNSFGGFAVVVTRKHYAWYYTGSLDIEGGQLRYPPKVVAFDD